MYWNKKLFLSMPPRSGSWKKVRSAFLKKNPSCAACGNVKKLECHHIIPYHVDASLELEESNLIVLCENSGNCHFVWGHLLDWKAWNPDVVKDTKAFLEKISKRLKNDMESKG